MKTLRPVILALLGVLLALAVMVAGTALSHLGHPAKGSEIEEDLASLEKVYQPFTEPAGLAILEPLHDTIHAVHTYLTPYEPKRFPGDFPILLEGEAGQSLTVRMLHWDHKPQLEWIIRDLTFCFGALRNKSFGQLSYAEVKWTGYLLLLTRAEAKSLDDNISRIWRQYALPVEYRGSEHAFEAFIQKASVFPSVRMFQRAGRERFELMLRQIGEFNIENRIDDYKDNGEGVLTGSTARAAESESAESNPITVKTTYFEFAMPRNAALAVFPILVLGLGYVAFSLWRQAQQGVHIDGLLRASHLLMLHGRHRAFNIASAIVLLLVPECGLLACLYLAWNGVSWWLVMFDVSAVGLFLAIWVRRVL